MENSSNIKTKDRILLCAIDLISDVGYANATMRKIAEIVGIKASSLYKHYKNKEEILTSIYALFKDKFFEAASFSENNAEQLVHLSTLELLNTAFDYFKQTMLNPYIVKIARIMTSEPHKSQPSKDFFIQNFIENPTQQVQALFDIIIKNEGLSGLNTRVLAEEYVAYNMFLYFKHYYLLDSPDIEDIEQKMRQHNEFYASTIMKRGK